MMGPPALRLDVDQTYVHGWLCPQKSRCETGKPGPKQETGKPEAVCALACRAALRRREQTTLGDKRPTMLPTQRQTKPRTKLDLQAENVVKRRGSKLVAALEDRLCPIRPIGCKSSRMHD